ncbi:MAG: transporter substrate-binding domain-containing protein [Cyanobacteria bacterium J06648_11]
MFAAWGAIALTSCGWFSEPSASEPEGDLPPIASSIGQSRRVDPEWAKVHRWGALRVGIDPAVGYDYLFSNSDAETYDGFEWQVLQAISAEIGVDVQAIPTPWSKQLAELDAGNVDVIWGAREAAGIDDSRFLTTVPYYDHPQAMLARSDREPPVREFSDLFGLRVGIVTESTGAALMTTYNDRRGKAIRLFASRNLDRIVEQIRQDELDVVVVPRPIATSLARASQDSTVDQSMALIVVGAPVMETPLVGVVQAERASIKDVLDDAIAELKGEGKLDRILEQWQL